MPKHVYRILLNGEAGLNYQTYDFGHTPGVEIWVERQTAVIRFEMRGMRTCEQLLEFSVKVFRDAYWKSYLLHAMLYNEGLLVEKIVIYIDGELQKEMTAESDTTGYFPYMYSMIPKANLHLADTWATLAGEVVNLNKSKIEKDKRFTAMYAFLAGKERKYDIDRFSNLWTAMNAYYDYITECYQNKLLWDGNYKIPQKWNEISATTECDRIGILVWLQQGRYRKFAADEAEAIWAKDYEVERALQHISDEEIIGLYDYCVHGFTDQTSVTRIAEKIKQRADEFEVGLFPFLLLEYPYHLRCRLLHGDRITSLFMAYNDYEVGMVKTVNYFLETFLNEEIPRMFLPEFWNDEKQEKYLDFVETIYRSKGFKRLEKK